MEALLQEQIAGALLLIIVLSAVPLLASILVGFTVSVLQAATQIQEQTLSFVPRMFAVAAASYFAWPLLAGELLRFTEEILRDVQLYCASG